MHFSIVLPALIATTSASLSPSSDPLPLIIWHGLGDNYAADGLAQVGEIAEKVNPGTYVYNIRIDEDPGSDRTATFFGDVNAQLAKVCEDLANHQIISTAPAINALGFSQGGQFLRGYIERCNTPPVHNLITFGSQHNGISEFQGCGTTDFLCKAAMALLKSNTWSTYVQTHLVPAQYYRSTNATTGEPSNEYLTHSNFLADINNEREEKNATYAARLASLNKFVMYLFEEDTTVIPKESAWFAQTNLTSGEVTPLRNRTIYHEDWLGLKTLDQRKGLVFKTTEGQHMQLSEELLEKVFKEYFSPEESNDLTALGMNQEILEL